MGYDVIAITISTFQNKQLYVQQYIDVETGGMFLIALRSKGHLHKIGLSDYSRNSLAERDEEAHNVRAEKAAAFIE